MENVSTRLHISVAQSQLAPPCLSSLSYPKSPLGTVEHLGDHLRSSRVLRSLVCLCGLLRPGLPQAPQDRDRGPLRGWEKLLGMEAGLR